jgi:hypothetical protein
MHAEGTLRDRLGAGDALIETLRWEPGAGFVRLERHLARMTASASSFAISFDRRRAEEMLAAEALGEKPLRLRLTLGANGMIEVSARTGEGVAALVGVLAWKPHLALEAEFARQRWLAGAERHEVAVAEVGHLDLYRRTEIGVAVVAADAGHCRSVLDAVERLVAARPEIEILSTRQRLRSDEDDSLPSVR